MSQFKDLISYMVDSHKVGRASNTIYIDEVIISRPMKIIVTYHTCRYVANSMEIGDFYHHYKSLLSKKQIEFCVKLISYKDIYSKVSTSHLDKSTEIYQEIDKVIETYSRKTKEMDLMIIVSVIITVSVASHIISNNIYDFYGLIFIPSSITYMLVLALLDYLSAFYSRKIVITMIIIECFTNALFLFVIKTSISYNLTSLSPLTSSLSNLSYYFGRMYFANMTGILLALLANYYIFSYLYKKMNFLASSLVSSSLLLFIYTPITDYLAFGTIVDLNSNYLISFNLLTNLISFFIWSACLQLLIKWRKQNI